MTQHPTWFSRIRVYPASVAGHIAQGVAGGILAATGHEFAAFVWLTCYIAYQGLSFARKVSTEGRGDTAGLDAFDYLVGFAPAYAVTAFLV